MCFFKVLEWRLSGFAWHSVDKSDGYSDDFIQKSNAFFDCIKKNKMFREAAYTIIKNFENEIGWQFFNTVKYNLSGSNHRKMFRDIEKIAITYALTLIKKERVNYYYYPTEKKLYKEKNKLEKIETQMKRKINHIEKLKSNLQNSDFFAKKLDKILK
ncbi:hypothetical protein [Campylobacter sp.]|uniref:hypothetical protein n=1 Tax=Campylobacter sp. TaxID=205 RepID=UPI002AA85C26|nr:hypothetical protein [Campylobacter sp.]MCI6661262.1 hypothetical protein [Campylobacter sp.]MCI7549535.1 hypothetical protein [Campylobacter sp.]